MVRTVASKLMSRLVDDVTQVFHRCAQSNATMPRLADGETRA
jgi:hypothetical protein